MVAPATTIDVSVWLHPQMHPASSFLFATGIENSYPTLASGARIDQMEKCGHYARWEEDFSLVRDLGLNALRYGPPYYRTHVAPNRYEWDSADAPMERDPPIVAQGPGVRSGLNSPPAPDGDRVRLHSGPCPV